MRNITEEARLVMNTRRDFVNYARVTLHDGTVLNLTPSDFRISGNTITDAWCEGEAFQLGSVIGKTASILLDNTDGRTEVIEGETIVYPHGKFSEYDFYMSYFELYIHLPNSTHYNGELIDTVIPIGTFTVTEPASHGATIEITGVDNMYMFDKSFNDCTLNFDYHPTLLTILNRCCQDCGVAIGYTGFTNETLTVTKKPKDITYRQVVSYIAQIAGCNAVIGTTGALQLKWYDMSPITTVFDGGRFLPWDGKDNIRDTLDGGSFNPWTEGNIADGGDFTTPLGYHNLTATNGTSISTDDIQFTGVMVSYEVVNEDGNTETQALHYPNVSNWDTYAMKVEQNPFIESQSIATIVANTIWSAIGSLKFRVFSCQSIQDPTIEAGDCALVYDVKGNIYQTVITNVTYKTGGMTDVSCHAESPLKQNTRYVNPAARAVAVAEQRQDDYNAMVAHFNELAYASTGYYETSVVEHGATITYRHDQPTLAASTNIIKITSTGTFISTDGGQSYNAGVDTSTATMLMNLIYVKGLNADWIKAGQIDANRLTANVITSINNATGSTTISGGKINIAGVVNGINAGTTTINGGKISTYTIDTDQLKADAVTAAKINVSNLASISADLGTITAGTIDAKNVTVNNIKAGNITSGTLNTARLDVSGIITAINNEGSTTINGGKIKTNSIASDRISATTLGAIKSNLGTVNVGGSNNGNGIIRVYDASGTNKVTIDNNGISINKGSININNVFKVTDAGALTATSAVIGGWTIGDLNYNGGSGPVTVQAFYKGSNLGKANTLLLCPDGYKVFASQAGDIRFGWQATPDEYMSNIGKMFSFGVGTRFGVTHDGDLYARNATVSGTISSNSGEIGPWTINSSGLSNSDDGVGAWIKPLEIACGAHGATLVKMIGKKSGSGYLSVEVNADSDYVRVYTNDIKKKTSSGTVSVQWNTSDRRVKKNIEDLTLTEAINLINSVLPRKFEMKDEPGIRYGFIAQELREVLDDDCAIEFSTSKDEDDYRAVHYDDFVAPLCMIVKKQQEEIDDLKERLAKLESIVNTNV